MDGKYLASNIGPLKTIGDGKVFTTINDLLNEERFKKTQLVAYSIKNYESRIVTTELLLSTEGKYGPTLYFRSFDFYKRNEFVSDELKLTVEHGIGFADYEQNSFVKLRDFYLEHTNVPAAEIS